MNPATPADTTTFTPEEDAELEAAIAAYIQACETGSEPDRQEFLQQHAHVADQLRAFLAQRDRMNALAEPIRDFGDDLLRTVGPGRQISYVGNYELLEEVARGGMGVVYRARQTTLGRIVAVKMIVSGRLATERDVQRFHSEAQAAAALHHPHIVAIHEVGQHEGWHYFSMDFIEGRDLATILRSHPLSAKKAATYVRDIASAIHYAHQQGTLHRDLKPSNVLIDEQDQIHITDFGLAIRADCDTALTRTGDVLGTPSYMPPEQAAGARQRIGPTSDVYALGAILYECLTGRPPFKAESVAETIQQVIHSEPAAPGLLNSDVPRDLETIALKCLEKEQSRRYPSAQHMADDLERYLNGEPIAARPVSRAARFARWCRRNPLIAALSTTAAGLLVAVTVLLSIAYLREVGHRAEITKAYGTVEELRTTEQQLRTDAETAEQRLKQAQQQTAVLQGNYTTLETQRQSLAAVLETRQEKLYSTLLFLAQTDFESGDMSRAVSYLEDCPTHLRDRSWERLKHLCQPQMRTFPGTQCLAISRDGRWLASARNTTVSGEDRPSRWEVTVWDVKTEETIGKILSESAIHVLAFHPTDATLLSGDADGVIKFWNVPTGELQRSLQEHSAPVVCLSLSADGNRLASASHRVVRYVSEGEVILWDLKAFAMTRKLTGNSNVAMDPAGQIICYTKTEKRPYGKSTTNRSVTRLEPFELGNSLIAREFMDGSHPCAFSSNGLFAVATGSDVEVRSVAKNERLFQFRAYGGSQLAFSPDGNRLAYSVHGNSSIKDRSPDSLVVRNLHNGERERLFPWYGAEITGVAFGADGLSLATVDAQGVKIWDISPPADPTEEILADIRQLKVQPRDWPQWGGSRSRVNTPAGERIPATWDLGTVDKTSGERQGARNLKWVANLGSQTYGNPVVANGKVFVGSNNGAGYLKRYPADIDLGVLLCFDEQTGRFLWQHSNEKLPTGRVHDWPLQGVCSTPAVDGDRLWYVSNRGEVVCLDVEGFGDQEDDGPTKDVRQPIFTLTANLGLLSEADASAEHDVDLTTIRNLLSTMNLSMPRSYHLQKRKNSLAWDGMSFDTVTRKPQSHFRVEIQAGELLVKRVANDAEQELLGSLNLDLAVGLEEGKLNAVIRELLKIRGFNTPDDVSVATVEPGQSWRINLPKAESGIQNAPREFILKIVRGRMRCEMPLTLLENEADVVWSLNMMTELGVSPHNMSNCSPLIVGDYLFVCTSNGVDETHTMLPAPEAPSFIALNRWTGQLLWTDKSPGRNIQHAQWGSPSYGTFGGQAQVLFAGGDGWVYSFDPRGDGKGNSKLLWKFDGNFKESVHHTGGRGTRNEIIAFPAIYDGLVYIVMGQDPEHGEGPGCLWCIDPGRYVDGEDISESLAVNKDGRVIPYKPGQAVDIKVGERSIANPKSAVVWRYTAQDRNGDGVIDFEEEFHRSLSGPVIKDDILYVADFSGLFHCLNAKTGKVYWTYDQLAACWNSALIVDGKVFIGDEDGDLAIFRHSADPTKSLRLIDGEQRPWHGETAMPTSIYMTPIVANNVLYVATKNQLFAVTEE